MRRPETRLQRKLLAWLLGPLAALLVLDTGVAYWNSQRFSNLAYDRALHEIGREIALHVRIDGPRPRLELSPRELAVLELLMKRAGRVVSKELMVNHLYGWGDEVGDNAIEVNVYRLRKKLEPLGCEIRTIRGMGYLVERHDGDA